MAMQCSDPILAITVYTFLGVPGVQRWALQLIGLSGWNIGEDM